MQLLQNVDSNIIKKLMLVVTKQGRFEDHGDVDNSLSVRF